MLAACAGLLAACSNSSPGSTTGASDTTVPVPSGATAPPPPASSTPGVAAGVQAGDWPVYHRTADRAGAAAGPALSPLSAHLDWTSAHLDGTIHAEPLVDGNRVVVATEGGTLYGLDIATGRPLWKSHLSDPVTGGLPCGNILPLGITGTPAIDTASHTVYTVTEKADNSHLLAAVDDATGEVRWQRVIDPPGSEPRYQQQRAALAVANGRVYVALGGRNGDCGPYHGWVVATGLDGGGQLLVYEVPSKRQAGIWAPSGIAVGADGHLFVATGNGVSVTDFDHGNALIRLDPGLREEEFFAPATFADLNARDLDLGSTGPMLLPGGLVAVAGKDGRLWVARADHLGGVGGQVSATAVGGPAFGGLALAGSTVLVPCLDGLRAVSVDSSGVVKQLWKGPPTGPAIVAAGAVWAVDAGGLSPTTPPPSTVPGGAGPPQPHLHAFEPTTGHELLTITVGDVAHFTTPSAAPGRILVAAGDRIVAIATQ